MPSTLGSLVPSIVVAVGLAAAGTALAQDTTGRTCPPARPLLELAFELAPMTYERPEGYTAVEEEGPTPLGASRNRRSRELYRLLVRRSPLRAAERRCVRTLARDGEPPPGGRTLDASVRHLWVRSPARCDMVVLPVFDGCSVERSGDLVETVWAVVEADARGRLRVADWVTPEQSRDDPRIASDPDMPDLDGDGWPEWTRVVYSPPRLTGVSADGIGEDDSGGLCDVPSGNAVELVLSRGPVVVGPVVLGGRVPDSVPGATERWRGALVSAPRNADGGLDRCPDGEPPSWVQWEPTEWPDPQVTADGIRYAFDVAEGRCRGWCSPPGEAGPTCVCTPLGSRHVLHVLAPGGARTEISPLRRP